MTDMSSKERLEPIIAKISTNLIKDIENVLTCDEISREIKNYYLEGIEPFLNKYEGILDLSRNKEKRIKRVKDVIRAANFYCQKAREYFSFFGIDFNEPTKSQVINSKDIEMETISRFLYSSVQLLYVILWEVFAEFLKPLEKLYYIRLCHAGIFPSRYLMFPNSIADEKMEPDFLHIIRKGGLFRVSESLPFEFRIVYQTTSKYIKECFDEGGKKAGYTGTSDFIDDFIRLFVVRNNVCHIGRTIIIQETVEKRVQSLLYDLSTNLPRIQKSCIGVIGVFEELAKKEVGS